MTEPATFSLALPNETATALSPPSETNNVPSSGESARPLGLALLRPRIVLSIAGGAATGTSETTLSEAVSTITTVSLLSLATKRRLPARVPRSAVG